MSDYCGTARGLQTHENRNEPPCDFCLKQEHNPSPVIPAPVKKKPVKRRRAKAKQTGPKPEGLMPCGTTAAYVRHIANGEKPCEPCAAAKAHYDRVRYYEKLGRPMPAVTKFEKPLKPCGTYAAAARHLAHGEKLDEACAKARKIYMSKYNRNRKK